MGDDHTKSTPNHDSSATVLFNDPERDRSGENVDECGDQTDQEGVVDRAELSEECSSKVEDEVDTSPLLHHLHAGSENRTPEVGSSVPERASEAVCPRCEVSTLRDDGHLVLMIGNDFSKLGLDELGAGRLVTKALENNSCFIKTTLHDEITWRLWKPDEGTSKDDGPGELETHGDTVRPTVCAVLGSIIDTGCKKKTDGNGKLVTL